ncbi:MAG: hypothetical protein H7Y32_16115, partial [Chloroflexales bacterium]|nr:hypothetical protein [Chloroflexales bacterium]
MHAASVVQRPRSRNRVLALVMAIWIAVGSLFTPAYTPVARAATFTVTTSADSGPGSLRQAIEDANASSGPDTISFNIAGTGVQTIAPASALPIISEDVTVDGLTQPGASCAAWPPTLAIELDATNAGGYALRVNAGSLTLRGLMINRYSVDGVFLNGPAGLGSSSGNVFECNFIGTDASGAAALGNGQSAIFANGASNNLIGGPAIGQRNVIAGNNGFEQLRMAGSNGNIIQGNYIGTNVNGTAVLGSSNSRPILITGSNNLIGGTSGTTPGSCTGACNIIAGGNAFQIWISAPGITDNVVQGNHIGVDASGTTAIGSTSVGIQIDSGATNTAIGSTDPAGRNIIGG